MIRPVRLFSHRSTETIAFFPLRLIQVYVEPLHSHNSLVFDHLLSAIKFGPCCVYLKALLNVAGAREASFVESGLSGSIKYHPTLIKMQLFVCFHEHRGLYIHSPHSRGLFERLGGEPSSPVRPCPGTPEKKQALETGLSL